MVIERYFPIWGGAENQLRQLAQRLTATGTEVEILTRRWSPTHAPIEEIDGVLVRRIGIPGASALSTAFYVLCLAWSLVRRGGRFDVLHAHGAIKLGALTALAARRAGRPAIAKIATAGHVPRLRQSMLGRGLIRLFRLVDAAISMTAEIDEELESAGLARAQIVRIGNGVDAARFTPAPPAARTEWRRRRGLSPDAVIAVYAGRLVRRKGLDILIDAWQAIDPAAFDAHLVLVGSGDDQPDSVEAEIRQAVAERQIANVTFAGPVPDPEFYLNHADLFLFPSRREGYPNALLEAMSAGAAVVSSRIGGCLDIVRPGETGLLVDPDDPDAFAEATLRLIHDPELRARLQQAARRQVERANAIEAVAAEYSALYERLARG